MSLRTLSHERYDMAVSFQVTILSRYKTTVDLDLYNLNCRDHSKARISRIMLILVT